MFCEIEVFGSFDVCLIYYCGFNECCVIGWILDSGKFVVLMSRNDCCGGDI